MTRNIKKAISVLLVLVMLLSILQGCSRNNSESKVVDENTTIEETVPATLSAATTDEMQTPENAEIDDTVKSFDNLNDPRLLSYMESAVYEEALKHIDSTKYVVDNVEAIYVISTEQTPISNCGKATLIFPPSTSQSSSD